MKIVVRIVVILGVLVVSGLLMAEPIEKYLDLELWVFEDWLRIIFGVAIVASLSVFAALGVGKRDDEDEEE